MSEYKTCTRCKQSLSRDEFPKKRSGHCYSLCQPCKRAYDREWYQKNQGYKAPAKSAPEYRDKSRDRFYRRNYGISLQEYEALLETQQGVCAICRRPERGRRLNVDHCHTTGLVRGLLCSPCNRSIGLLQEDVTVLQRMIAYLSA